jgi:hypothetical protein
MSLTPKIGCVQHDCDQCVRVFAELSSLRTQVSTLQARADAGDRLRDEVDSFRVGLDGKGPAFDAIKYYLQEATAASKSETEK